MAPFHLVLLAILLLPFRTIRAGLSIGTVIHTSTCYESLDAASGDDGLVDRDEYVVFVNLYSDGAFAHVDQFEFLPAKLVHNFNSLTCGCDDCRCDEAYLSISGAGGEEWEGPTEQEQLYLHNVCAKTKEAIDGASLLPMTFSYQLQASDPSVTADAFFAPERNFLRADLLTATSKMMNGLVQELFPAATEDTPRKKTRKHRQDDRGALRGRGNKGSVSKSMSPQIDRERGGRRRRRRRRRTGENAPGVFLLPISPEITDARDVECSASTNPTVPPPVNCIQIITNFTLGVASDREYRDLSQLSDGVDRSIVDGTFEGLLLPRSAVLVSNVVPAVWVIDSLPPSPRRNESDLTWGVWGRRIFFIALGACLVTAFAFTVEFFGVAVHSKLELVQYVASSVLFVKK